MAYGPKIKRVGSMNGVGYTVNEWGYIRVLWDTTTNRKLLKKQMTLSEVIGKIKEKEYSTSTYEKIKLAFCRLCCRKSRQSIP